MFTKVVSSLVVAAVVGFVSWLLTVERRVAAMETTNVHVERKLDEIHKDVRELRVKLLGDD